MHASGPEPEADPSLEPLPHRPVRALVGGLVAGLAGCALLAIGVMALSLLGGSFLLLIIEVGFGSSVTAVLLKIAAGFAVMALAAWLVWRLARLVLGWLPAPTGLLGWSAAVVGAVLGMRLGWAIAPAEITSTARQFATGQSEAQRAAQPAQTARLQRLKALFELYPEGPEAMLYRAVNQRATVEAHDRARARDRDSKGDPSNPTKELQMATLEQALPSLPPAWRPVALGLLADMHASSDPWRAVEGPRSRRLQEAGLAGSRAYRLLDAQEQERIAQRRPFTEPGDAADTAWRRALMGYAAAGAHFEIARVFDELLPEPLRISLRSLPLPQAVPDTTRDTRLSERLWNFAQALGDPSAWNQSEYFERQLALAAALRAMELAPTALGSAKENPVLSWVQDRWAAGRFVLALRHARGECMAALDLSDAIRQRWRPQAVSQPMPPASAVDMAWATAWAETAQACAASDAERARAASVQDSLAHVRFAPGVLEAARDGVAATLAALR